MNSKEVLLPWNHVPSTYVHTAEEIRNMTMKRTEKGLKLYVEISFYSSRCSSENKMQENSFHYSPVLLKRTVSFGEFNKFCNSESVIYIWLLRFVIWYGAETPSKTIAFLFVADMNVSVLYEITNYLRLNGE